MPLAIQPYRPEHEPAVAEFNQRLRAAGEDENMVFYKSSEPRWLPRTAESRIYNEFFVATDNGPDGMKIRGGYALKTQDFLFPDGQVHSIGYYHHPLSEGIVDKAYAAVGMLLLRDAMQRAPLLYCLGMGGYDRPLPQMLIRLGWTHCPVPFFFRVLRPAKFLRQMQTLRESPARALAMDLAAFTGTGWLGSTLFQGYHSLTAPATGKTVSAEVQTFSDDVQELWDQAKRQCSLTAVRDCETLGRLYPPSETHLTRIEVRRDSKLIGWAVVGERRKDAKYGGMRVGSVVDCLALPGESLPVVQAATAKLARQGFDLILTNQSHEDWGRAFKAVGYLTGPSNFLFAASKKLAELLGPFDQIRSRMHFTRADGDGLPRNF
jgi:hypothetical protein